MKSRTFLLVLLILFSVLALAISSYTIWRQRSFLEEETKADAARLATVAAFTQGQIIERAKELLVFVSNAPEVSVPGKECSVFFSRIRQLSPRYANIGVANTKGDVVCSAIPLTQPVNIIDRGYFKDALEHNDFSVGEYQVGRITGKPAINFGYPVRDAAGRVKSIVFIALDLGWLSSYASAMQLPDNSVTLMMDRNGTVLARHPELPSQTGALMFSADVIGMFQAREHGAVYVRGMDNIERLYGYHLLGGQDIVLTIGIPKESVLGWFDRSVFRALSVMGGLLVAAVIAHIWYSKTI